MAFLNHWSCAQYLSPCDGHEKAKRRGPVLRFWDHTDVDSNPASPCSGYVTSDETLPISEPHVPSSKVE